MPIRLGARIRRLYGALGWLTIASPRNHCFMEFDNLDDLRVLLATAESGSLTSAGKRCGLSTAAVSSALKRLETSLGVRLFERTTRSVRPTVEGEVMIDHARRALDLVFEGQALVRDGIDLASGELGRLFARHAGVPARVQALIEHLVARFETLLRPGRSEE